MKDEIASCVCELYFYLRPTWQSQIISPQICEDKAENTES